MERAFSIAIACIFFFVVDIYLSQAIKTAFPKLKPNSKRWIYIFHWATFGASILALIAYNFAIPELLTRKWRTFIMLWLFINYFSKIFGAIFLLFDDLTRIVRWVIKKARTKKGPISNNEPITRAEFMSKTALIATAVPILTMGFGILSGAHDYRIRKRSISLPNLPREFDGIRIAQLSDIHSGSFFNKTAVKGGVEMLLNEKPDIIFFTGDIVNYKADEVKDYIEIFEKIKAPLGVYSILGNHDYGDYYRWPSQKEKIENLDNVKAAHAQMGWNLLLNRNERLKVDNASIGIIGVENWGAKGFTKYGNLDLAYKGIENEPVKLLLSHDPSHWDAQVRPNFGDIDVTFSGHTHGFQFGIELPGFRWSPSQYIYEQWADLYQKGNQYIYVNRGFGFLGYPGRIGILPEITIIELNKA